MSKFNNWQKRIYIAIIIISLGVVFSTTMAEASNSLGTVFIAIGCLVLISGMHLKRKTDQNQDE